MTDLKLLHKVIEDSGMTMTAIAEKMGINRVTLYNRFNGVGEFSASEIASLKEILHLTKPQRDRIFFGK